MSKQSDAVERAKERADAEAALVPKRYMLVGGNPFRDYTGTGTFTSLRIVGYAADHNEALDLTDQMYEECGGLLLWIDRETGRQGEP